MCFRLPYVYIGKITCCNTSPSEFILQELTEYLEVPFICKVISYYIRIYFDDKSPSCSWYFIQSIFLNACVLRKIVLEFDF